MSLLDAIRQALRTLTSQRGRAVLTLFGVVWGTASVVFLLAWGKGVRIMLDEGFARAGKDMIELWAGHSSEQFTPATDRRHLWYVQEDLETLRRRARLPRQVVGEAWHWQVLAYRQRALNADVRGAEPAGLAVRGAPLGAGRWLTPADLSHRRRVAILGHTVRERLLGAEGGVGAIVRIGGTPFTVVGLLDRVGTQLNRDRSEIDEMVFVPMTTSHALWPSWWTADPVVSRILVQLERRADLEPAEVEVRAILAERLGVAATDAEAVGAWSGIRSLERIRIERFTSVLALIALTTLLVGGIGVAAMMLDSLRQRRQEIGIRRAAGARTRDLLLQILFETFAVTALGGALGVGLGVALCAALGRVDAPDLVPLPVLEPGMIGVAVGVFVGVGLLAGLLPAWRATRIDPAIVLRME